MAAIYLNASYGGEIYHYSKDPKEGYEQHTSSQGNISYRKYYKKGLYGYYQGVTLKNGKFGQQLSVHVQDAQNNDFYLQIPFLDQKNDIGTLAESLIIKLPFLQKGTLYRFFAYNMPREGTNYSNVGVSIKFASDFENVIEDPKVQKLSHSYTRKADNVFVQGDIPPIKWEQGFGNTVKANKQDKNNYLYQVLTQHGTIEQQQQTTQQPTQTQQAAQQQVQQQTAQNPGGQAQQQQVQTQQPVAQVQQQQQQVAQTQVQQVVEPPIQTQQVAQQQQVQTQQVQTQVTQPTVEYQPPPQNTNAPDDLPF